MHRLLPILLFFLFGYKTIKAQELNCRVIIQYPKTQSVNVQIYTTMENQIFEFMNGRRWTTDVNRQYSQNEKIECTFTINIREEVSQNEFSAELIVQSFRPVFNTNYKSPVFSNSDRDFSFVYNEFQNFDYNDNDFYSNLTSLLAYYAYIIIGYDNETFEKGSGKVYFQKALNVINNVPSNIKARNKGWSPFDGIRNRAILVDNLINPRYAVMSDVLYEYHLKGMDVMYDNTDNGRKTILEALRKLDVVYKDNPNAMILRTFFVAKTDEIVSIFSKAPAQEKTEVVNLCSKLDPINSNKFKTLLKK